MRKQGWGVGAVLAAVVVFTEGQVAAHPGGTDQYGCHVDSSTGTRHCHNDGETTDTNWVPSAEAGLQVGHTWWRDNAEQFGCFGSFYIQPGGSFLFMVGVAAYYHRAGAAVAPFIDFDIGMAWLGGGEAAITARLSGGIKLPIFYAGAARRSMYVKLGAFAEGVADGVNAEPIGVHLAIGAAL